MLSIASILSYALAETKRASERFKKLDDEHLLDTKTGVEFHLYDDGFKLTHGDDVITETKHFTANEQQILWMLKQAITDPVLAKEKEDAYPAMITSGREMLSSLYETPTPISSKDPVEEVGAIEYAG